MKNKTLAPLAKLARRSMILASVALPVLAAAASGAPRSAPATAIASATIPVANCNDSGPGSLRSAIAGAVSGDTIDMSALACREIDLTSGAIEIAQDDLSLVGGPPRVMKVDGGRQRSVFRHSGIGTLYIKRMDIAHGSYTSSTTAPAYGGCLYSAGNVELIDSLVRGCRAKGVGGMSVGVGGGIYASGSVKLVGTRVVDNVAVHGNEGAIMALGGLTAFNSRICRNRVYGHTGWEGDSKIVTANGLSARFSTICDNHGGGIWITGGNLTIANSTISGNVGPQILEFTSKTGSVTIVDSTISGNTDPSTFRVPILDLQWNGPKSISNSTIAFNHQSGSCGPSVATVRLSGSKPTLIDSTIISDNFCDGAPGYSMNSPGYTPAKLVGANNLIRGPSTLALPPDTMSVDPKLAALADNGGPAETHALPADSPAIDNGNNEVGLEYDQRGHGFQRVKGAQADIGSFER